MYITIWEEFSHAIHVVRYFYFMGMVEIVQIIIQHCDSSRLCCFDVSVSWGKESPPLSCVENRRNRSKQETGTARLSTGLLIGHNLLLGQERLLGQMLLFIEILCFWEKINMLQIPSHDCERIVWLIPPGKIEFKRLQVLSATSSWRPSAILPA